MFKHLKIAILFFPGSNCEQDLKHILVRYYNANITFIWHKESFDDCYDCYLLPGGFSYGDYLRSGSLAKISPAVSSLANVIQKGKLVLGICNGFQILTEAHFLPGALLKNKGLQHICKWVELYADENSVFKNKLTTGFSLPISHSEGNFFFSNEELDQLMQNQQIFLRYKKNPNGSTHDIAGITNKNKNVFGLMPHPERAFLQSPDTPLSQYQYGKIFFDHLFSIILGL